MKRTPHVQKWIRSALVGLALAASTTLSLAANISYTFDSDTQGWGAGNAATSVLWDGTVGRGSNGCLKYTLTAASGDTLATSIDVSVDTSAYFGMEFDILIDAASGTDGNGNYGNMQFGYFDAGWSWQSTWYGGVGNATGRFSTWKHVVLPFQSPYGVKEHLQIQLQASPAPYSGDVIVYIDNVVLQDGTPPNKVTMYDFAWPDEVTAANAWGATWSQDTTLKPDGALKIVKDCGTGNTGWQDGAAEFQTFANNGWDISKFTYLDFDLYLDAPTGQAAYGGFQFAHWYSWVGFNTVNLSEANIGKWTHYSLSIPSSANTRGLVFHPGGNNLSNVFTYYIDNVTVWKPADPPTIKTLTKETGSAGVKITMDVPGQWQRDAICVPSGQSAYSWYGQTPVSYSFTIADYPDLLANNGFETHLFIANQDTVPGGNGVWNQTYGGCDWNVADYLQLSIRSTTNGNVVASIDWKTNLPGAGILTNEIYHPVVVTNGTAVVGTWTLTFNDNTSGTLTGPGGISTNFTLPAEMAAMFDPNTYPNCFIQFGMFKNDGANDGRNDGASGTFSRIQMSGGFYPFDETFPGPGIQGSGTLWRTSSSTAVQWVPSGTGLWLSWTTPDDGFSLKVCTNVSVPMALWSDAGVTYTYPVGATRVGAVPAANIPAGDSVFFRLLK